MQCERTIIHAIWCTSPPSQLMRSNIEGSDITCCRILRLLSISVVNSFWKWKTDKKVDLINFSLRGVPSLDSNLTRNSGKIRGNNENGWNAGAWYFSQTFIEISWNKIWSFVVLCLWSSEALLCFMKEIKCLPLSSEPAPPPFSTVGGSS